MPLDSLHQVQDLGVVRIYYHWDNLTIVLEKVKYRFVKFDINNLKIKLIFLLNPIGNNIELPMSRFIALSAML